MFPMLSIFNYQRKVELILRNAKQNEENSFYCGEKLVNE